MFSFADENILERWKGADVPVFSYSCSPVNWLFCNKKSQPGQQIWVDYYGFSVGGGYEHARLLFVESTSFFMICRNTRDEDRRLQPNDIIMEMNGQALPGMCAQFAYNRMKELWDKGEKLDLVVLASSFLNNDLELGSFLQDRAYPRESFRRWMQRIIRHSIYLLYPPVTTRAPRVGEVQGKDYLFWSEKDVQATLDCRAFLERGEFDGVFYGTLYPRNVHRKGLLDERVRKIPLLPKPRRRSSFRKAVGMLPIDSAEEVPDDDLESRAPVMEDHLAD
ncbi:hypothetical protein RvY_07389 [Ramazzottius varieornatus]|uniref:Guanylate kinase-like domain-containing protein n=1 Tax=Ramazzottius varieornatus TaxID=947166 RepID=A0A1D1V1Z7_RAMVA|nr:hypothetical protein RvY_07389 [Ramazzottius varieornatus]